MTKHDWIWVAIRIFGIFLFVQAVIAIPNLIGSAFGFYLSHPIIHSGQGEWDNLSQTLRASYSDQLVSALAKVVIYGSIGTYLAKGGGFLHKMIYPPDSNKGGKLDV